ncbi:hypothetical protein CI238_07518 [Colletotrichum incanum]|uniref:Zn(2)-C6 fungal-type domain-containing protein n=1 Tax=Colletotrichum incanum TaxID=1573173 RepID=A0A166VRP2_COLIC|nr:hypothetical protein CI238_07518 [Colletotrichum incanum]
MSPSPKRQGRGKPRGIRHDRDCVTCKVRRVKCDLNRPSCGPCLHHNVPCGGYTQRIVWRASHSTAAPPPSVSDQGPRGAGPGQDDDLLYTELPGPNDFLEDPHVGTDDSNWTTHYLKYLNHFRRKIEQSSHQVRRHTTLNDPLSSIWDFAWKRMTQAIPVDDATDINYALCHTAAVKALMQSVEHEGIKAIFGIVTFAFIDVYKGPFAAWSRHLRGARAVLDLHSPTPKELSELCSNINGLQEVISLLCWYDTTGLVVRRDRALIFEDWHRDFMDESIFDLVGCPRDTFMILTAIAKGGFLCVSREHGLYLAATEQLLRVSRGVHDHAELLRDAWRYSAVLIIYEAESSVKKENLRVIMRELTDRICDILQSIPAKSAKYRHLPFAAFMAGRHAQSLDHSQVVQTYWRTCNSLEDPIYPDGGRISQPTQSEK